MNPYYLNAIGEAWQYKSGIAGSYGMRTFADPPISINGWRAWITPVGVGLVFGWLWWRDYGTSKRKRGPLVSNHPNHHLRLNGDE